MILSPELIVLAWFLKRKAFYAVQYFEVIPEGDTAQLVIENRGTFYRALKAAIDGL